MYQALKDEYSLLQLIAYIYFDKRIIDMIDLNKIVHPNTENNVPEEIGCLTTLYIPDVTRFDFFLTLGIAPILRKAKIPKIHPTTMKTNNF